MHLEAIHTRAARTRPRPADHAVDRLRIALEDGLDRAVRAVADPAGHASLAGQAPTVLPEEDALDVPDGDHPAADAVGHAS